MRRMIFAGAAAGVALLTGYGSAFAQAVVVEPPGEVYVAPPPPPGTYYYGYYAHPPTSRGYGYYPHFRDADEGGDVVVVRPRYRGGCGAYAFWNGERCIDARY